MKFVIFDKLGKSSYKFLRIGEGCVTNGLYCMHKDHSVAENIQMNIQLINFNILLGLSLTSICPTNDIKR